MLGKESVLKSRNGPFRDDRLRSFARIESLDCDIAAVDKRDNGDDKYTVNYVMYVDLCFWGPKTIGKRDAVDGVLEESYIKT